MSVCCDTCPFSPTCEEEEDQASHSYRDALDAQTLHDSPGSDL